MVDPVNKLFVYGSLRSDFKSSGHKYISDYFNLIGVAKVKGKLYALKDYPAALPTQEECFIIGELYSISNLDEFAFAMKQLDDYEGVNTETVGKSLYKRELTDIYMNGKTVLSWIYWYNGDIKGETFIAGGDVMEYLRKIK